MKFEELVVGQFNEMAVKASEMVLENPGRDYPILIIQGEYGCGKSYLVNTIVNELPKLRTIKSSSAHAMMNDMIQAMKGGSFEAFRKSLELVDILIIDDIQELTNRTATQDIILKTLKYRVENKKQTIMTISCPINKMKGIYKGLRSFLASGLLVEIHEPSFEDKILITKQYAKTRGVSLYDDVAKFVAEACSQNLREIEGAILKLMAYSGMQKKEITLDFAKEKLSTREKIEVNALLEATSIDESESKCDEKYSEAVSCVSMHRVASASFLQRRLGVGYNRASCLIEEMERNGVVGPAEGSKPRKILVPPPKE